MIHLLHEYGLALQQSVRQGMCMVVDTVGAWVSSVNGRKVLTKGKVFNETGTIYSESKCSIWW